MSLRSRPLTALLAALALVGAYLAASLSLSGAASAIGGIGTGTVTVSIVGKGTVTATGISCTEAPASDCTANYQGVLDCPRAGMARPPAADPPGCFRDPEEVTLTAAADRDGFAFDHFTGCDSTNERTCTVLATGEVAVTAVFVDAAPPTITLTSPAQGAVVGISAPASVTVSDNTGSISKVDYLVNGVVVATKTTAPYSASLNLSGVSAGAATVSARATDSANLQSGLSTHSITIDRQSPSLTVSGPANGEVFGPGSTQTWSITATDSPAGVASVACRVVPSGGSGGYGPCSQGLTGHSVTGLTEGGYEFSVMATDQVGNLITSGSRSFTIDATAPDTSLTSGPATGALLASRSVTFGVGTDDASATMGCRLYRSGTTPPAYAACTSATSFTASGLDDGSYVFEARATDAAGNADASPVTRTFTVDATPPTVSIAKQPKHKVKSRKRKVSVAFAFASEPGAAFRCTLDGKAVSCSASSSFKVKAGKHTLTVTAVDAAGNTSQPAAVSWQVKRVHKHH